MPSRIIKARGSASCLCFERVGMALSVYVRYNGDIHAGLVQPVRALLDEEQTRRALVIGLALRLAHTIAGSAPGVLGDTVLRLQANVLELDLSRDPALFAGHAVERRFRSLARAVGAESRVTVP